MTSYYLSEDSMDRLINDLKLANVFYSNNTLHLIKTNNIETFSNLQMIHEKCQKITVGDSFVFEYEMDVSEENANILEFKMDNGETYKASILSIGNLQNTDLSIIMTIE